MKYFLSSQKGGKGGRDISLVVSQTRTCRMAGSVSPQRFAPCAIMQPNVFLAQVTQLRG